MKVDIELADSLADIIERFDHVSIAVHDLAAALSLPRLMGGEFLDGGDIPSAGFKWVQFTLPGDAKLELIQPLPGAGPDNFLVRFLEAKGEGVHHVTLKVSNLLEAVSRAEAMGFTVVGVDASHRSWKQAFVHPKTAAGVVVQFAQWTDSVDTTGRTLEDVLRGIPDRYL
ncbi:MAG: VOC family protein [Acidimicrobiia bacterium]